MKNWQLTIMILCLALAGNSLLAQNTGEKPVKEEKKVVIIKKSIDEDGNEVTEKIIRTGEDAEDLDLHQDLDNVFIIEKDGDDQMQQKIRIRTDGKDLDLDEDLDRMLRNVEVDVEALDGEKKYKIRIDDQNGDPQIIEWEGKGELPENIRQELEERGIQLHEDGEGHEFNFNDNGGLMIWHSDDEQEAGEEKKVIIIKKKEDQVEGEDQEGVQKRIVIIREKTESKPKVSPEPELPATAPSPDRGLALKDFAAFPNPTQGKVQVRFSAPAVSTQIQVTDVSGKVIYNENINNFPGQYDRTLNLEPSQPGTLIINVMQGEKLFTEKIVVN